jgi:hypothetical protein
MMAIRARDRSSRWDFTNTAFSVRTERIMPEPVALLLIPGLGIQKRQLS